MMFKMLNFSKNYSKICRKIIENYRKNNCEFLKYERKAMKFDE